MQVLNEIAIHCKDRIVLLDKDLSEKCIDVSKRSEWYCRFHQWKGRHYKNLQQGPGWSFPAFSFPFRESPPVPFPPAPSPKLPPSTKKQTQQYEVDIPEEVRRYFQHYETVLSEGALHPMTAQAIRPPAFPVDNDSV